MLCVYTLVQLLEDGGFFQSYRQVWLLCFLNCFSLLAIHLVKRI